MPKYLQVTPQFNPISYAERIAPLEEYQKEYDKQMDALDEQGVLADTIKGLINEEQDAELMELYNNFNNKLNSVADEIIKTGRLGNSRRYLKELRHTYIDKLLPIQTAYNQRAKDAEK